MTTSSSTTAVPTSLGFWADTPTEAEIDIARDVSGLWGWVLGGGIVSVGVGVAVLAIRWDLDRLAMLIALVFAVRAVTDLVTSASRPHRGAAVISGVLGLVAAGVALAWPGPTLFVLATLVGVWLVVDGVLNAAGAMLVRGPLWGLWLLVGIGLAALGVWALGHPGATLAVLIAIVGARAILSGFVEILASLELRRLPDRLEAMRTHPTEK